MVRRGGKLGRCDGTARVLTSSRGDRAVLGHARQAGAQDSRRSSAPLVEGAPSCRGPHRRGVGEPGCGPQAPHPSHGRFVYIGRSNSELIGPVVQTSITSRALDGLHDAQVRKDVVAGLLKYLDTDTVWCVSSSQPGLCQSSFVTICSASTKITRHSSSSSRTSTGNRSSRGFPRRSMSR